MRLSSRITATSLLTEFIEVLAVTVADPDTMTLKQALQEPDADKFIEAMIKEVNDHANRKHWSLTTFQDMRRSGYKGKPIMAVW